MPFLSKGIWFARTICCLVVGKVPSHLPVHAGNIESLLKHCVAGAIMAVCAGPVERYACSTSCSCLKATGNHSGPDPARWLQEGEPGQAQAARGPANPGTLAACSAEWQWRGEGGHSQSGWQDL